MEWVILKMVAMMPRRSQSEYSVSKAVEEQSAQPNVERRDVEPQDLVRLMRAIVGMAPDDVAEGEEAVWIGGAIPALIREVDVGGWIAWCIAGLLVFAESGPTMSRFRTEAKRLAVALAMLRAKGKITVAAQALGVSRSVMRKHLRDVGLYPWPGTGAAHTASKTSVAHWQSR